MIDQLRLCRLYYAVPMSLAYTLTVYYAWGGAVEGRWAELAATTAALALVIAAGYVLNDVCDAAIDRRAALPRPMAAGRVSRTRGTVWGASLMVGGIGLASIGRWQYIAALAAVAATLVLYDLFSKRSGVAKQLLAATLMTSIYPLAFAETGGAVGTRAASLAIFPAWLFLTAFGYEILKDIRDRQADPQIGGRPTLIQRQPRLWRGLATAAILTGLPLLAGPLLAGCGHVYLAIASVAAAAAVASVFLPIRLAIAAIYAECFIVGLAAAADVMVLGM